MAVFLFVPSILLIVLGIMYITRKNLYIVNSDSDISEEQIEEYVKTRNANNNCIFWGIVMLLIAIYFIILAISLLVNNALLGLISSIVMLIVAFVCTMYYYNAKSLKNNLGDNNGSNKNVKNKTK